MASYTGSQRAAARRTVWTLPPRLSGIPKRLSRQRVTLPCDSPPCLLSSTTPAAPADVDVELPVNGRARDFDLELLGDVGLVERPAAVGADVGQRRLISPC